MPLIALPPTIPAGPLVAWFVLLAIKHVLADFTLQPEWMALGKDRDTQWLRPLLAHCLVHGALTSGLMLLLHPSLWIFGPIDFTIHLLIDWGKGGVTRRWRLTPAMRPFWAVLGVDQTLHHLTGFCIAIVVASH